MNNVMMAIMMFKMDVIFVNCNVMFIVLIVNMVIV